MYYIFIIYEMNKKNAAMPVIRADQVIPSHEKNNEPNIMKSSLRD